MARSLLVFAAALLAACPTLDLGEEPAAPGSCRPDPAYFQDIIWPQFVEGGGDPALSCVAAAGCHDAGNNGRSSLRFETAEPIDFGLNYDVMTRFLNCATPEASSALTKPQAGLDAHGGGDLFDGSSPAVDMFLQWFAL